MSMPVITVLLQVITKAFREKMMLEMPYWNRSISLPPREPLGKWLRSLFFSSNAQILTGMFLEKKCTTGERSHDLTYEAFLRNLEDYKWEPPLANHCLILPRNWSPSFTTIFHENCWLWPLFVLSCNVLQFLHPLKNTAETCLLHSRR